VPQGSAGILMYRRRADGAIEVLLGHFGGPFWRNKDDGAWAMPKGLIEPGESAEAAARREFEEELSSATSGPLLPLGRIVQKGGKSVEAFALEGDLDAGRIESNLFTVEWPPRSGDYRSYPEIDRAGWFTIREARTKILPSQRPLLDLLLAAVE
jgi:predicted NUDIX family NTP pyrophosphohydrolase